MKIKNLFLLLVFGFLNTNAFAEVPDEKTAWENAGFSNPEFMTVATKADDFSKKYTHELTMSLVMFRYKSEIVETVDVVDMSQDEIKTIKMDLKISGWTPEILKNSMRRVAEIYSQCGIKIDHVKLVVVDAPDQLVNVDSFEKMVSKIPVTPRPTLFFTRERLENDAAGHAYTMDKENLFGSVTVNTAWIAGIVNTAYHKNLHIEQKQEGYSTVAHELAHLLANSEHINSDDGMNLLGGSPEQQNSHIRREQCDAMKTHPSVHEIKSKGVL